MKQIILKVLLIFYLITLSACSTVSTKTQDIIAHTQNKVLLASGYSKLPNTTQLTQTQKRQVTEQTAKLNAYRALAKQLYREPLDNNILVADQVIKNEVFRIYLDLFLREAKVLESKTILDQQKVTLALNLTPRFFQCISSTVNIVTHCLQEDNKTVFTRIGYQQAELSTVNLACAYNCSSPLYVSGFSKEKSGLDKKMLSHGLYDSEWTINIALRSALRYFILTELIFN